MRTTTTNGAGALGHTGNNLVNFFFNVGASRNNVEGIRKDFANAFATDPLKATAIMLYARDIRHNGAGERKVFRTLLKDLSTMNNAELAHKVTKLIPEIGRFDDLKTLYGSAYELTALNTWANALMEKNVLAAKWAKREDKKLQRALGLNEANLRKLLSSIRKEHLVETKMCDKNWSAIEYGKLPSVAGARYAKAFKRNDGDRYQEFLDNKNTTVNAGVLFPHDVYRMYKYGNEREAASKYWEALPDLGVTANILPISDVSGSMMCPASGKIQCLDVSIALGVYLAQRNKGIFNDKLMTFSENPTLVTLPKSKDIGKLFSFVANMDWGGSTNFQKVYETILAMAINSKAKQEEIPSHILVLSDMQFDSCNGTGKVYNYRTRQYENGYVMETLYENMAKKFEAAGYKLPKIIFWNLNAQYGNFPVAAMQGQTALVSGFSPNVLKAVLQVKDFTPVDVMEEAIEVFVQMLK